MISRKLKPLKKDRWTDKQMDIGDCRVTLATEEVIYKVQIFHKEDTHCLRSGSSQANATSPD